MSTCFRALFLSLIFTFPVVATALPPLGLTQIKQDDDRTALLSIVDGVAYVSTRDGIFPVSSIGLENLVSFQANAFGSAYRPTRAVSDTLGTQEQ